MTHERVKKKNKQRASEINLAVMLLCIVFFFLVCHFPRILLNVHEFFMLEDMISCGPGKCLILDRYTFLSNLNVHLIIVFGLQTTILLRNFSKIYCT